MVEQIGQMERMAGTRVSGELLRRMENEAQERRWSLSDVVRDALEQRYSLGRYAKHADAQIVPESQTPRT